MKKIAFPATFFVSSGISFLPAFRLFFALSETGQDGDNLVQPRCGINEGGMTVSGNVEAMVDGVVDNGDCDCDCASEVPESWTSSFLRFLETQQASSTFMLIGCG